MTDSVKWFAAAAVLLALLLGATLALGRFRWRNAHRALLSRLEASPSPPISSRYRESETASLPPPVRRYFRAVLREGQPAIAGARVEHVGMFNMSETGEQWKPFASRQTCVTNRPGFVWDARVSMLPGVPVLVHDAYLHGSGILHAAIAGVLSVADLRGEGPIAEGELMRWLAEAAWYPTALLPGFGVRWDAVDDRSALATLTDGPLRVTLNFRFGEQGLIESVRAEARGRTVRGQIVMTPWEGRWSDYREHEGVRVPTRGEVAWVTPTGRRPYWRGTITSLHYTFAP